ncbi:MAG: hypothetical protein Q7W45_00810 [Bacteroidota bacterium]|nr:hypothetical protein [Bacteroidota bacterium]MDP3146639.1 hypothetical protein [Bacteroidota bacterium]
MSDIKKYLNPLIKELETHSLKCFYSKNILKVSSTKTSINIYVGESQLSKKNSANIIYIPIDYIITRPTKIVSIVLSKLNLNKTIFARNCIIEKIDKTQAVNFFNSWHFFESTTSAYNYGLFYKEELIGAASFSKGRKMNRLPEGKQSFELIRFCCKSGITVTGGLSKLMSYFCNEKNAGDIMTYVDKQFSKGESFIKAGFKLHSETPPIKFLVNKKTFERIALTNTEAFDKKTFYLTQNLGNLKLIYSGNEK